MKNGTYSLMSAILWVLAFAGACAMSYELFNAINQGDNSAETAKALSRTLIKYNFMILPFYLCSLICLGVALVKRESSWMKILVIILHCLSGLIIIISLFRKFI